MPAARAMSRVVVVSNPRERNSSTAASTIRRLVARFSSAVIRMEGLSVYCEHTHIIAEGWLGVKQKNERAHKKPRSVGRVARPEWAWRATNTPEDGRATPD